MATAAADRSEQLRPRVLVVDDEAIPGQLAQETLEALDYDVVGVALDADEALLLARTHTPDLALLDIVLDGSLDGIELARLLREEMEIGIVFVTSFADMATVRRARLAKPNGYLVKPFSRDGLYAAVETALAQIVAPPAAAVLAEAAAGPGQLTPRALNRVLDHIEKNFNRDLTLAALAALVGLTPPHFAASFRNATGSPPHRFIVRRRMEEARRLLSTTDWPVAEVAEAVGYESAAYFSAAFKKAIGVSPAEFRRV